MSRAAPVSPRQSGFVLVGVLVTLALAAAAAVDVSQRVADQRLRDAEEDLLDVGDQYRRAIESYWRSSPGAVRSLPTRLEDLVNDMRFPQPRRHLRKLYPDPVQPEVPWGLVRQGQAVVGVYSQSEREPFRRTGFATADVGFELAQRHADWRFVARLGTPPPAGAPASAPVIPVTPVSPVTAKGRR